MSDQLYLYNIVREVKYRILSVNRDDVTLTLQRADDKAPPDAPEFTVPFDKPRLKILGYRVIREEEVDEAA